MSSVNKLELARAEARYSRDRVTLLRAKHAVQAATCNSSNVSCSPQSDERCEVRSRDAC